MSMSGGSALLGTGLAGEMVDQLAAEFGSTYKLTFTNPDGSTNSDPARATDCLARAIINYIKSHAVVRVTVDGIEYTGTLT